MYGVVLAAALLARVSAPGWDDSSDRERRSLDDLKKAVENLRKEQQAHRIDELKQTIDDLRSKKTDEKIDDLRRSVEVLRRRLHERTQWLRPWAGGRAPWRERWMPWAREELHRRALVVVSLPGGATLYANDQEVSVADPTTSFLTPELEPGKDYYYEFRVKVARAGESVTRTKRVPVRAGSVARLAFEDMTPAGRTIR